MISITTVIIILAIHWFADFVLQTDKQAKGKSKNWNDLLSHTVTYSVFWLIPILVMFDLNIFNSILFVLITFISHTAQDYITSRINSRLHQQGRIHSFFISVGFDQLLHFIQLLLTYHILTVNL